MSFYQYVAKDKDGKTIKGTQEAPNKSALVNILSKEGLVIISAKETGGKESVKTSDKKISLDELAVFSRQLATLVDSGIPGVNSLEVLADQVESKDF